MYRMFKNRQKKLTKGKLNEIGCIALLSGYHGTINVDQQIYSCPSVEHLVPSWPKLALVAPSVYPLLGLIVYPGGGEKSAGLNK